VFLLRLLYLKINAHNLNFCPMGDFFKPCPSRAKAGFKKSPSGWKVGFWWLFLFMQRSLWINDELCNRIISFISPKNYIMQLNNFIYYIRLYFTVFLLARSNTRDIPCITHYFDTVVTDLAVWNSKYYVKI
jgi:hypothetical protein